MKRFPKGNRPWWLIAGLGAILAVLVVSPSTQAVAAQETDNEVLGGIGDILGGALSLPMGALAGTLSGPPIIGTVNGVLFGALNTLSQTTRGILRLTGVAIPIAAKLAPFLPIFL